jgi:hypothetical protein
MPISVKEAAIRYKCTPEAIRMRIHRGQLDAHIVDGLTHVSELDMKNLKYRPCGLKLKRYEIVYTCNGRRLRTAVTGSAALQKKMSELRIKGALPKVINE